MATLADKKNTPATFSGLKSTAITAGCFILGGILLKETLQRLRRYPDEDRRRKAGEKVPDRGLEGWAMGYLYRARTFVAGEKTEGCSEWPVVWFWEAYKRPQSFYETHCGVDATVYLRFLRGTWFWILCHLFSTFPILLAINFYYSPDTISKSSIERSSLTSLVTGTKGLNLLPIHVVFVWLVVLSWFANLVWIGYGALRIRRNELRRLLRDETERNQPTPSSTHDFSPELDPSIPDDELGWRYRTVLVRNIPPPLRTEAAIQGYFEQFLSDSPRHSSATDLDPKTPTSSTPFGRDKNDIPLESVKSSSQNRAGDGGSSLIVEIVLVRRQAELNELWAKYGETLHALETAHVQLARNVMAWVGKKVAEQQAAKSGEVSVTPLQWLQDHLKTRKKREKEDLENAARDGDDLLISSLRPFLPAPPSEPLPDRFTAPSIWDALHSLRISHPAILDRFQPLHRLRFFHKASVPALDYWTAKHNLLFMLIEDKRAHADTEFEAASTAFVTFSRAADARRARHELRWRPIKRLHRGRVLDCKVTLAPEVRDLHWDRLVLVSLQSDLLRGILMQAILWAATLFWLIPLSFLIGLLSLESLTKHLPALAAFLERNSVAESLVTSLLPTAILAILNLFVCPVLGIGIRRGKTLITESKWSAATQAAYWRFMIVNFLIIFSIGLTAFSSFLDAFKQPTSVLEVVASKFPTAATFFVSYMLLQAGIQCGVEIALLGIAMINHSHIRNYIAPRKRYTEAVFRFFGFQSALPNHLFITSILFIFAVLNPLVIAFGFIYFSLIVLVFKNQFALVYYRRCFEGGGRVIFRRILKYSTSILILAEFVYVAFFWVLKRFSLGGACIPLIPITVAVKIIGQRWFDHLADELEEARIDIVCGEGDADVDLSVPLTTEDRNLSISEVFGTVRTFATQTLPALALRPSQKLPHIESPSTAAHWKTHSESVDKHSRGVSRSMSMASKRPRAQTAPDDSRRPMLETIMSREEGDEAMGRLSSSLSSDHRYGQWAAPSEEGHAGHEVENNAAEGAPAFLVEESEKTAHLIDPSVADTKPASGSVVAPHPPTIRDDRPVSHLKYRNPALHVPLSRTLWLPADPLKPVDLGEGGTVSYSGRCLVSSEGGRGSIGSWEEDSTLCFDEEEQGEVLAGEKEGDAQKREDQEEHERHARIGSDELLMPPSSSSPAPPSPHLSRRGSQLSVLSGTSALRASDLVRRGSLFSNDLSRGYTLKGNERVRVAADVAAKIEAQEGTRQVSVLDEGVRRRGSSSASQQSPSLRRRATRSSFASGPISPMVLPSPNLNHSPTLRRHPDQAKPSPPPVPVFTDEPSSIDPSSTAPPTESAAYPFPPPSPSSPVFARRNTGASLNPPSPSGAQFARDHSPSDLSTGSPSRRSFHSHLTPGSPTNNSYPPTSPRGASPRKHTILGRSRSRTGASIAPSLQFSAHLSRTSEERANGEDEQEILVHPELVGEGGAPQVSLSQRDALRIELLEEARKEHERYAKREERASEQDRKNSEGHGAKVGILKRLLVGGDPDMADHPEND